ncbi:MAG: ATP synthase subunit I [Candidatus Binatia bacterium]
MERNNLILVLVGTVFTCLSRQLGVTLSFIAGGLLTIINLRLWRIIVEALTGTRVISRRKLVGQILVKFFGLIGVLAVLILYFKPEPIPLLLGLSTVVVAIALEGISGLFKSQS